MQLMTETFEDSGVKITVQAPNGFSQTRLWRLHRLLKDHGTDGIDVGDATSMCFYLANTVEIEGSLPFPVPLKNVVHSELIAFIRGLGMAKSALLQKWDNTINDAMTTSNDDDLLPPEELSQKKEKTPALS